MNYKILIFILGILTFFPSCKDKNSSTSTETGHLSGDSLSQKDNYTKNEPGNDQIYTWINKLRMRAEPNTESAVIAELPEGEALTFLDEKTDFTQKINIRGTVMDEPWLKVRTKTGQTGWVYGGGVKFYRPKIDATPSPYAACFKNFVKNERASSLKRCMDQVEQRQLKKDSRFVKKEGQNLVFTLLSGKKKHLSWVDEVIKHRGNWWEIF